ncbi:MAG: flavin reductase, partial [Defluviitaleaceae bacterium]|nr:flavin reductase [Defluviitaleaceae bacterium]
MDYGILGKAAEHFIENGAFLSVRGGNEVNAMTISWGFFGFIWQKPHFIALVRPQRHTKKIIDAADSYTVSLPIGCMKDELAKCGSLSGKDTDKSKIVTFAPSKLISSPIIKGCQIYIECKIVYKDRFEKEALPESIKNNFYKDDFHHTY